MEIGELKDFLSDARADIIKIHEKLEKAQGDLYDELRKNKGIIDERRSIERKLYYICNRFAWLERELLDCIE